MKQWEKVRLGEVLLRSDEITTPVPDVSYKEITVRLWGRGVALRGGIPTTFVAGSRRYVARAGQLIVSRIDARNGALGIVPQDLEGALVTNDFPLFNIDPRRVDSTFLAWLIKRKDFVDLCRHASEGTTNRVRLKEERFLAQEIAVPPLVEQRRIVARIEELAKKIEQCQRLRSESTEEAKSLMRAVLAVDSHAVLTPMRDIVRLREPDVVVHPDGAYQFAGVYSFGRGVFKGQLRYGTEFGYRRLTRIHKGELIYPKLMAWEGAIGVVPPECDGYVVSPEFPVFSIDESRVLPEVLDVHFRTPATWAQISAASTGTNVRRRRLHPKDFLDYKVPVPSRDTQLRLRSIYERVRTLQEQHSAIVAMINALFPAVLDRAFKGEL